MTENSIWQERLNKHGHTGWANPFIYVYDQIERLSLVSNAIGNVNANPGRALDFGCGTGNFSLMLLKKGFIVDGCDPYVIPEIKDPNFAYITENEFKNGHSNKYDLIISITVLAHIMDEQELINTLERMRGQIASNGKLLIIEYALTSGGDLKNQSNIQVVRSLDEWRSLLSSAGWEATDVEPISYPEDSPSPGYANFNKQFLVRALMKLIVTTRIRTPFFYLLKLLAKITVNKFSGSGPNSSPLKLIHCNPIKN